MTKTVFQVIDQRIHELKQDYGKNEFNNEHDRLVRIGELELLVDKINETVRQKALEAGLKSKQSHVDKLSENS